MKTMNCKLCQSHLADLLLDDRYLETHPEYAGHLAACESCRTELAELRATYALLDAWSVPEEPTPYFDSRLRARLREAEAARPEGPFERFYAFLTFSTGRQLRSAMAGALMFVVLVGGGSFAAFYESATRHPAVQPSATVNDLKILDNNAQALQQMDQLLDSSDDSGDPPST
jgi:anti-sigma factor RsiW